MSRIKSAIDSLIQQMEREGATGHHNVSSAKAAQWVRQLREIAALDEGEVTGVTPEGMNEYQAMVRDARRYRWLRWGRRDMAGLQTMSPPELDAAIDAAMEAAK